LKVPPDAKVYKTADLAQCTVYTVQGEMLGSLTDVLPTGGNDVYVVRAGEKELLIPATKAVVRLIDLESRRIEVDLPPGLRDIYEV
jgi:16S rRNA processing protein RimM